MIFCRVLFLICCFLLLLPVYAHHGGEGGLGGAGIAGPIVTIPAYPLPEKSKFISIITNYQNEDIFSDSKLKEFGGHGEEVDIRKNTLSPSLTFGLGITEKLSASIQVPYIFRYGIKTNFGTEEVRNIGNSIGVGDISFFSLYEFFHSDKHELHAALLTGLKIPSGVRREKNRDGDLFKAEHQPGTGSWDPQIGLAVSKHIGLVHLDSNFLYRFVTKGVQDTNLGDVVSYNFAVSYLIGSSKSFIDKLFPAQVNNKEVKWHLIGEMNGNWVEKPQTSGSREENEGGTLIYLSPGIRMIYNKNWITNLSIGLPTIHNLNGRRQPPNIRLIFGVTRIF